MSWNEHLSSFWSLVVLAGRATNRYRHFTKAAASPVTIAAFTPCEQQTIISYTVYNPIVITFQIAESFNRHLKKVFFISLISYVDSLLTDKYNDDRI